MKAKQCTPVESKSIEWHVVYNIAKDGQSWLYGEIKSEIVKGFSEVDLMDTIQSRLKRRIKIIALQKKEDYDKFKRTTNR